MPARATQRFVRGGGDEIGDLQRIVMQSRRDQTGVVGHVDEQFRADLAGDFREFWVWNFAGIGAGAGDDQLWLVFARKAGHLIEVDAVGVARHSVGHEVIQHAGDVQLHAVRQMPAMGQIEPQHRIARLHRGQIHGEIRLAAGVRLNVGVFRAEELLGAIAGQRFHDVDIFAAAVIAPTRIALRVFVREHASHGLLDGGADIVLAGDHLQAIALAARFVVDGRPNVGIVQFDKILHADVSQRII